MKENTAHVQFIKVTKESVLSFLGEAHQRVVIAKAGYFVDEIERLLALSKAKVRCEAYVDTDEISIRYGFGEQAALELINEILEPLNVQSANYTRMAIVIVDEYVMLYSRVALAWEEVPDKIDFQNDFNGGKATTDSLLRKVEGEPQNITIEDLTIRLNTELAKKPPECLEYIVVHEMAHLLDQPITPASGH